MVYFDYFIKQQLIKEISFTGAWGGPGYYVEILLILLITAILCGIWVINNKNPILAVLSLIGLIGSISIYLILIGLTFIGLSYIIIYLGAVFWLMPRWLNFNSTIFLLYLFELFLCIFFSYLEIKFKIIIYP
jgi:hypothetical protein